jgi:two-component system nitrogen regulation sensor histidine kinase NtrY
MRSKPFGWSIVLRTIFVFSSLFILAWSILQGYPWLILLIVPIILIQFYFYYRAQKKAQDEIEQFVESVNYRDFSRHFDVKEAPTELQPFRTGFNQINDTFKVISKEKETQYLYLRTILEFIDTGILSYNIESGEILWMNEALKKMLLIPYLKTITSLAKRNQILHDEIIELEPDNSIVTSILKDKKAIKILVSATSFQTENKKFKLVSFQNISEAVEITESNAWKKLLSVMTHEIMNSVAPISSLAETLKNRVREIISKPIERESALNDVETGMTTIQKRSEGLLKFTESYRNLSKINKANISKVRVVELLEHVQQLLQPSIDKKNISLDVIISDPLLEANADAHLIEQVLINLLLNAIDAVKDKESPKITIEVDTTPGHKVSIQVNDNGAGIADDVLDKIFIPFFSTKKTGSGIGLNLCKQIMQLHKGSLTVESAMGIGSTFILTF